MTREERLTAIVDLLGIESRVDVAELVTRFDISPATARRDLDELAERRLLTRTRGGAAGRQLAYELPARYARTPHAEAKSAIARAAQTLIQPGMRVGLSGGTTSTAIAHEIGLRDDLAAHPKGLTIVTNAINIAAQLVIRPHIRVVVTGGVVHASYELTGPYSDLTLERLTLDLALIGVNGVDADLGPTVENEHEARVNSLMASRADNAWIVTDASKIGRRALVTIGGLGAFTGIVTDASADRDALAVLRERGMQVLVS